MSSITIAGRKLGDGYAPFIVGEVGINHNGDVERAIKMVSVAKKAGCDAVKFATLKAGEFCNPKHMVSYWYRGELVTEPEIDMFRRCELPDEAWRDIRDECERNDIIFFSTPQNESDLKLLLDVGVPAIKVGSDDLTNLKLIAAYAKHGLPLILSTGMADARDILAAGNIALACGCSKLVYLVCTSEYPCAPKHANLKRITTLKKTFPLVGFSDHTVGTAAATVATTLGACYLEKHFTLNNFMRGPDHAFSANPWQLEDWVKAIRGVSVLMGTGRIAPTEQERVNRVNWRRASGQQIRGAA